MVLEPTTIYKPCGQPRTVTVAGKKYTAMLPSLLRPSAPLLLPAPRRNAGPALAALGAVQVVAPSGASAQVVRLPETNGSPSPDGLGPRRAVDSKPPRNDVRSPYMIQ